MNIEQQRASFERWHLLRYMFEAVWYPDGGVYLGHAQGRWEAYQAALASPEVSLKTHTLVPNDELQALRDALQEVVDAADGEGWKQLDPGMEKQRAALAAMEKQK